MAYDLADRIYGCLLGGLIGDAMGAPVEGKSFSQIEAAYGQEGIIDFDGSGTDDTAIREQLLHAIISTNGQVSCDEFADTFLMFWSVNYGKWWVPVRNMAHKIRSGVALPADAGYGNAPSSSSAMAISPMGMLNAMNPRQAALETFDVAGLIHSGPSGFCRDAACAMAAAVAEALRPDSTAESIQDAAVRYLHRQSAHEMLACIEKARALATALPDYGNFRAACYAEFLQAEQCDSRETVPVALAIFGMAGSDSMTAIRRAVNFGRDADTIGTMVGGLCGAFRGSAAMPVEWVQKVEKNPSVRYREMIPELLGIIRRRARAAAETANLLLAEASADG